MKLNCKGIALIPTNVEVSSDEFLNELLKKITNDDINSLEIRNDGYLYSCYDISHHGTPTWEYSLITKDESKIALFKAILELKRCIKEIN